MKFCQYLSVTTLLNDLFIGVSLLSWSWLNESTDSVGGAFMIGAQYIGLAGLAINTGLGLIKELKNLKKVDNAIDQHLLETHSELKEKRALHSPEEKIFHHGLRLAAALSTLTMDTVSLIAKRKMRIWQVVNLGLFILVFSHEAKITLVRAQKSKTEPNSCFRGMILTLMTCVTVVINICVAVDRLSSVNAYLLADGIMSFTLLFNEPIRACYVMHKKKSQDSRNSGDESLSVTNVMLNINA